MSAIEAFRRETRAWLDTNCPDEMRQPMTEAFGAYWGGRRASFASPAERVWFERMAERRWTAPDWALEYGGAGLSPEEARVLGEELKRIGARPPLIGSGLWMLGPALLEYGDEAQKRQHLPPIARGEIRWAQGYSEPGAGSDLASLRTRADDCGDYYRVTGSKIWSSYAQESDWMFCLVRSEPDASKHLGISFLLIDLATPGVTTRPIRLIDDTSDFCEVFFENVQVPKVNRVGEAGGGWSVAKALMAHEREMIGASDFDAPAVAGEIGRGLAPEDVAGFTIDLARCDIDLLAFQWTAERMQSEAAAGIAPPAAMASVMKLAGANLEIRRKELAMQVGGTATTTWTGDDGIGRRTANAWLRARASAIAGGTNEVQLNIIAKHALRL
jgi:acyl-CoA dehydrogenase